MPSREARDAFKSVLMDVGVSKLLIKFLMEKAMMEQLSDLASYFPGAEESEAFHTSVKDFMSLEGIPAECKQGGAQHRIAMSRLKEAVNKCKLRCKKVNEEESAAAAPGVDADWEAALPTSLKQQLDSAWASLYPSMELDMYVHPAGPMVNRRAREIQRGEPELHDMRKVKALVHMSEPSRQRSIPMQTAGGEVAKLQIGPDDKLILSSVIDYYFALRIEGNAWAKAGPLLADSKITPGQRVVQAPLSVNLDYADSALRHASATNLPPAQMLAWMEQRDKATRTLMVRYMRRGWPQGEALTKALQETDSVWRQVSADSALLLDVKQEEDEPQPRGKGRRGAPPVFGLPPGPPPSPRAAPPPQRGAGKRKRVDWAKKDKDQNWLCYDFQHGNCVKKQSECPKGGRHMCATVTGKGQICGSHNHGASRCPLAE